MLLLEAHGRHKAVKSGIVDVRCQDISHMFVARYFAKFEGAASEFVLDP